MVGKCDWWMWWIRLEYHAKISMLKWIWILFCTKTIGPSSSDTKMQEVEPNGQLDSVQFNSNEHRIICLCTILFLYIWHDPFSPVNPVLPPCVWYMHDSVISSLDGKAIQTPPLPRAPGIETSENRMEKRKDPCMKRGSERKNSKTDYLLACCLGLLETVQGPALFLLFGTIAL